MRFQVPQFINVEDKIFGPLTVKQFVYLAGGAGLVFIIYQFLPFYLALLVIAPVVALALALAFYKVNEKPFVFVLESALKYFMGSKLYIWKKTERKPVSKAGAAAETSSSLYIPKLSDSRLKDLTWSLDITENVNPGSSETMRSRQK